MKGILWLIFYCILLTSAQSLNGVYTAAIHYKKNLSKNSNKKRCRNSKNKNSQVKLNKTINVFIMVDTQIDPNEDTKRCCEIDDEQNKILIDTLHLTASSDNPTAFIIDIDSSEANRAFYQFYQHDFALRGVQVGVHTNQALKGLRHKNKFGSINYYHSDFSGNALLSVIRSFEIIERYLELFKFEKDTHLSLFYNVQDQDRRKKIVIKRYGDRIREALQNYVPDASAVQLNQDLRQLMEKNFMCDGLTILRGLYLLSQALDFLETPAYEDTIQVRDYVWNFFAENSLDASQAIIENWVYPLQRFLSARGIEHTLSEALQNYQTVLISCTQDKILSLHTVLKKEKFYISKEYKDAKKPLDAIVYSNLVDAYCAKVGSNFCVHVCNYCLAVEDKNTRFINDDTLPDNWFCSQICCTNFTSELHT